MFQFINNFANLYYIAFIKETAEGECDAIYDGDCMQATLTLALTLALALTLTLTLTLALSGPTPTLT